MEAVGKSSGVEFECLLFDMDDTLYPRSSGLNQACRKNIEEYMLQHLQMEENEVPRMCLDLYREYGTTMAGLKALGYEFDNDEFHDYVHGKLPYDEALKPDPLLRNLLLSLPQRKIIFTNADKAHAAHVLNRLGLEDCFEGVICFETLNPPPPPFPPVADVDYQLDVDVDPAKVHEQPTKAAINTNTNSGGGGGGAAAAADNDDRTQTQGKSNNIYASMGSSLETRLILCKPALEAIKAAIMIANVDPRKTIFFDDSVRNIQSGKAAGLHTVIVGSSSLVPGADHALSSIHNIKQVLPQLWKGKEEEEGEGEGEGEVEGKNLKQVVQSATAETAVLA